MTNILLLSENTELKSEISKYLLEDDYTVVESNAHLSGQLVFNKINLIIFDATSSKNETASFVSQLKTHNPLILIIVVVDDGNVQIAVQSIRAGAIDALALPLDKQKFLTTIKEGISQESSFHKEQIALQQTIDFLQSLRGKPILTNEAISKSEVETTSTIVKYNGTLHLGELLINTKQSKAYYQDAPIDLTPSQFKLLNELGEANGRVVPFEELYFHLHGIHLDRSSARTALSAHMSYLRNKLTAVGCGEFLVNVRGRGYLLEIPEKINLHSSSVNLDLLLEQLPIILWTTDTKLCVTSILGDGLVSLGLEPSELIGLSLTDFPQLDNPHHTITAHNQALQGKSIRYEQELRRRVFQLYIEPSFDENEQIIGCVGLALDITERKEVEESYQLLVNNSHHSLTIFQNGRFVFANGAVAELTGYSIDELLALDDPIKLFHPDDRPAIYANLRRRIAGDEVPAYSEYRIIRKDGSIRWVEQTAFATKFRGQLAIHTSALDRTQEKHAMEARRQLEEMYHILVKNLPNMAVLIFDHDLRYMIADGQALEEMGFTRNGLEGKTIWDVLPADRASLLAPYYHTALEGQQTVFDWTVANRTYEIRTLPLKNIEGVIIAGMFIIHDVTRYKVTNP